MHVFCLLISLKMIYYLYKQTQRVTWGIQYVQVSLCLIQFTIIFRKTLLVSKKRIDLYGIRIDAEDIAITIQWYEQIPGMYGSDLVNRLYCNNPLQFHSHTQLIHVKISMTQIYGTVERHPSERYKIPLLSELLHGNLLQCKLNSRN